MNFNFKKYLILFRSGNLLMTALVMVFSYLLLSCYNCFHSMNILDVFKTQYQFILYLFSVICVTAAGYIINDIIDSKADLINKPEKVIVGDYISIKKANIIYGFLVLISIIIPLLMCLLTGISIKLTLLNLFCSVWLFLYSVKLKGTVFIGNLSVAILSALVPISVLLFANELPESKSDLFSGRLNILYFFTCFAALGTLAREIIKDAEDIEGDKMAGYKTLAVTKGIEFSKFLAILILFILGIILGFFLTIGFSEGMNPFTKIIITFFLSIPLPFLLIGTLMAKEKRHFSWMSQLLKIYMVLGILCMLLFTL